MNILHLKYAVEVEKTGSITQAAEHLFMGQPNLSKAIRELETNLGITLFKRTSKGVVATQEGEIFLKYAKSIIAQVDAVEALYSPKRQNKLSYSFAVSHIDYAAEAFLRFASDITSDDESGGMPLRTEDIASKDISFEIREADTLGI
ncbi:MAG: LysR family transcriptional regulator, partial [Eubacteriales bacterium]